MKIGTIGTGMIVEKFLNGVKDNGNSECLGVYSRKEESGRTLADKFGISKVYTDYNDMLNNPDIDFIYIASPNSLHFEHCKQALYNDKHVICEKPFTSNEKEFCQLEALAKERNRFLFEAITTIHLPNMEIIREHINTIGKVHLIRCNFTQYSSRYDQLKRGEITNIFDLSYSGGSLMDLNIYNIHFVVDLFGEPQQVHYYSNKHESGIDTSGIAILQYDGCIAECCGAKDSTGASSCTIYGESGTLHITSQASMIRSVICQTDGKTTEYNDQYNDNVLTYEVNKFNDYYRSNDYNKCWTLLEHSGRVMRVLDRARKSAGIQFPADLKWG